MKITKQFFSSFFGGEDGKNNKLLENNFKREQKNAISMLLFCFLFLLPDDPKTLH